MSVYETENVNQSSIDGLKRTKANTVNFPKM